MVLAGRRPVEIAAKLQRTKHAVARRAQLLHLSFKLIVLSRQQPKVSHDGAHARVYIPHLRRCLAPVFKESR